jgi:hypothetical protein
MKRAPAFNEIYRADTAELVWAAADRPTWGGAANGGTVVYATPSNVFVESY